MTQTSIGKTSLSPLPPFALNKPPQGWIIIFIYMYVYIYICIYIYVYIYIYIYITEKAVDAERDRATPQE